MFNGKRIVCYELNEVPMRVLDWFSARFPASAIARLMHDSRVIQTVTEDVGHLSPWITWPTLHRGVTNQKHMISDFGQNLKDIDAEYPPIWNLLARSGRQVGMFGSLHSYPLPEDVADNYAFYVPDTFAAGPECFPNDLEVFQSFNLAMMDRSGRNVSAGLALGEITRFLAAAPRLGLRGMTLMKLVQQVGSEKFQPSRVVRRRTSQVQIAFDFFLKELRQKRPEAVFFFTNHVASSMHRYWPAQFPEDYRNRFWSDEWQHCWHREIEFTMREASAQIGELMRFVEADSRYSLAVMTSMGQAAVEQEQLVRTQLVLDDVHRFMTILGFSDSEWRRERAMVPCYVVAVPPQLADVFSDRVGQFRINGDRIPVEPRGYGVFRIEFGQTNLSDIDVRFGNRGLSLAEAGLRNLDIQDESGSYAYHVPQGCLMLYTPSQKADSPEEPKFLSTLEIAPAILANFGIQRPGYMIEPGGLRH